MRNKENIKMFWYGTFAKLKMFFGILIMFLSIILGFILSNWLVFTLIFIVGLVLFIFGKQQRFDYERQSGTILHRGDW
jgi:cbb3-type cytochrome oxidase subunit 3